MMMQNLEQERNFIKITLYFDKPINNLKILYRQGDKIIFQELSKRDIVISQKIAEINLNYCFQIQQFLKIENHDNEQISDSLILIGDIVGKQNYKGRFYDHIKQETGQFEAKITSLYSNVIRWQWKGQKLLNTDGIFGKSDPFLRFLRLENGEQWVLAHQTEMIKDNLNPIWDSFEIELHNLNNGCSKRIIKVECWDHSKKENHHFIGSCLITEEELQQKKELKLKLNNDSIKSKCGYLEVKVIEIIERQNTISYMQQGHWIQIMIGIDYTKSNLNEESLHNLLIGKNNEYVDVMQGLASILIQYSRDESLEAFGFGGIPKFKSHNESSTSHCFPLNLEENQFQIKTLKQLYQLYQHSQKFIELSSPTLFAPFLKHYYQKIFEQNDPLVYNVLIIITDGDLHDFEESNKIINECGQLPISIIFVGVGEKQTFLIRKLKCETRNIVQYVKFQDFDYDSHKMTQVLLKQFQDQFLHYLANRMIK